VENIEMHLREIGWDDMDWIDLAQDIDCWRALVNTVMNFGFHKILGNYDAGSVYKVLCIVFTIPLHTGRLGHSYYHIV
jgi:hypothetical protein